MTLTHDPEAWPLLHHFQLSSCFIRYVFRGMIPRCNKSSKIYRIKLQSIHSLLWPVVTYDPEQFIPNCNISFSRFQNGAKDSFYHSLTWSCTFPNENDTYYFAHCYPYTYSDLQVSPHYFPEQKWSNLGLSMTLFRTVHSHLSQWSSTFFCPTGRFNVRQYFQRTALKVWWINTTKWYDMNCMKTVIFSKHNNKHE